MDLKKIEKFFIFGTIVFLIFIFALMGYYYYLVNTGAIQR